MPFLLLLLENHQVHWWILRVVVVTAMWVLIAFTSFNNGLQKYNSGSLMGGRL